MSGVSLLLVFTDLDGSLLDHHSYRFDEARSTLDQLQALSIPVIPATSKTRPEIEVLRCELHNSHPFIVENGAAIFIPVGYFPRQPADTVEREGYWIREFSSPREKWLQLLLALQSSFGDEYDYFFRAGGKGVAAMTGLEERAAELANRREYSEPVQWLGNDVRKTEFVAQLTAAGATALQGGRFLTITGDCDKGRALAWLRQAYCDALELDAVHDLAIGDSGNDVTMLEAAESALVIRSPVASYPQLARSTGVGYSTQFGPAGWAEGVGLWLRARDESVNSN